MSVPSCGRGNAPVLGGRRRWPRPAFSAQVWKPDACADKVSFEFSHWSLPDQAARAAKAALESTVRVIAPRWRRLAGALFRPLGTPVPLGRRVLVTHS